MAKDPQPFNLYMFRGNNPVSKVHHVKEYVTGETFRAYFGVLPPPGPHVLSSVRPPHLELVLLGIRVLSRLERPNKGLFSSSSAFLLSD